MQPAQQGSLVGTELLDLPGQLRLLAGGLVRVDDPAAGQTIQQSGRFLEVGLSLSLVGAAADLLDGGLEAGALGTIALVALDVLTVPLFCAACVSQSCFPGAYD